jgi:hypothetical protein
MEFLPLETLEPLHTEFQTRPHEFTVGSFLECIVYNSFILVDGDGTCRVDYITTCSGSRGAGVKCAEDELFL